MNKTVNIGGKDINFAADGALPIVYRQLFPKRSFFNDIQQMSETNMDTMLDFIFAMAYNADPSIGTSELKWYKEVSDDPFEIMKDHSEELTELFTANLNRSSTLEKKETMKQAKKAVK
jgi:hypothetical protein